MPCILTGNATHGPSDSCRIGNKELRLSSLVRYILARAAAADTLKQYIMSKYRFDKMNNK